MCAGPGARNAARGSPRRRAGSVSGWTDWPGLFQGTTTNNPAYEANNQQVPVGTVVQIKAAYYDLTYDWVWVFDAPGGSNITQNGPLTMPDAAMPASAS